MTIVRAAEKERRDDVKVERVPEPVTPKVRIAAVNDPAEREAESKAEQALAVQRDWEPDLRGVNLHEGDDAAAAARSIDAAAFTRGNDVYLGADVERGTPEGDHVLAHELAHVEQGHPSDEVHRYPSTALAESVNWRAMTGGVFRPGEGVSGGVYILSDKDPESEIPKVVVKPVFGETGEGTKEVGEQLSFGDQALAMIGVKTPVSRVARGAEMEQLIQICLPHQPERPTDPGLAELWKPLGEAESFVVMSEVPKMKGSLGGMSVAAGTSPEKMQALFDVLFNDNFLFEFGQMCVGDMLVGNMDRLNGKKTNLGNVAVSVVDGKISPWAVDTTASLGKFEPKRIAAEGGTELIAFASAKSSFELGPEGLLELVFNNIVYSLEGSSPPPVEGVRPPVEVFTAEWNAKKAAMIESFARGWRSGLAEIYQLVNTSEGRGKMKALVDQQEGTEGEESLQYQSLKTNAMYLAGRALDGTHDESARTTGGYAAYKKFQSFDQASFRVPVDEYFHDRAPVPKSAAFTAEWEQPPSLPAPKAINVKKGMRDYDPAKLDALGIAVNNAKYEIERIGDKKKGKKVVPRNRVMAAEFVANSYLIAGGAYRASASAMHVIDLVGDMELIAAGGLKPAQVGATLPTARFAKNYLSALETVLKGYLRGLEASAASIPKIKRFPQAGAVADRMREAAKQVTDNGLGYAIDRAKQKDPEAIYQRMLAASQGNG